MSKSFITKSRKKSLDVRNRNNNILSSDKKQNITFEEQNSQLRIYNSERKNMNTYLEFRNESPSPHPNIRVNQISTSWKNEAAEIKDKYINNATSNFKGGSICTKTNNINQNLKSDQQNKNNLSSLKKGNSSKSNNSSFWMENLTPITNTNRKDKDKSRENISFDLKDNKTNFINNVYAIKKKIIAIPSLSTKNENKEKNMDEIMKLKIKRKDLEKQTHKMENEMQKLKNKIFDKNEKKHKDIESALNVLKQEHEKSKKLYQTYKGEKLNEKLSNIFSKAKKNFETIFFFKIKGFYISEKNKIHQVNKSRSQKIKKHCFILWREIINQEKEENKRKEKLKEDLREEYLNKKADRIYHKNLCYKYFKLLKSLTVNLRNIKRKKKSAYGRHPEVKSKINNFLVEMKKKTDLNLEKFKSKNPSSMKHQKNNEIKKSLSQNSQINKSIFSEILLNNKNNENDMFNQSFGCNENSNNIIVNLEEKQENTSYKSERSHISKSLGKETGGISNDSNSNSDEYQIDQIITNIPKPICIDNLSGNPINFNAPSKEKINALEKNFSLSPLSKNTEKTSSQTPNKNSADKKISHKRNFSSQKETLTKNNVAKIKDLEERAKIRKENNNVIKQKHFEKNIQKTLEKRIEHEKKIEEEKQKAIENKQKIQQKKKEELLKKETIEMLKEREVRNIEKAVQHHLLSLKKYFIMIPLKKVIMKKREKIKKAQKLYEKHLMKFCFESLNENLALKRIEKNIKLSKDLEKAKSSYEKTLKTKTMNGFLNHYVESFEEAQKYQKTRNNYLTRISFFSWFKLMPRLREKKMAVEEKYGRIIKQFRFVIMADRVLRGWKSHFAEQKIEKTKKGHKDVMWKKVNGWLNDYSEQKKQFK